MDTNSGNGTEKRVRLADNYRRRTVIDTEDTASEDTVKKKESAVAGSEFSGGLREWIGRMEKTRRNCQ